jgi:hypothetical protein
VAPIVLGRLFLRPGPGGTAANDLRLTLSSTSTNYPVIEAGQHPMCRDAPRRGRTVSMTFSMVG